MRKTLSYLKSYKKECILAPLFKLLEAGFELFVPIVIAQIIDIGVSGKNTGYVVGRVGLLAFLAVCGLAFNISPQMRRSGLGRNCDTPFSPKFSHFPMRTRTNSERRR